jgi:hypothetical protein
MNITHVKEEYAKERRKLINKGVGGDGLRCISRACSHIVYVEQLKESQLPPLEEELEKRIMKHFAGKFRRHFVQVKTTLPYSYLLIPVDAEIEMAKRRAEFNLRGYNARERIQEDAEKEKVWTYIWDCLLIV